MNNKVSEIVLRDNIRTKEYKINTIESNVMKLKDSVILNTKELRTCSVLEREIKNSKPARF